MRVSRLERVPVGLSVAAVLVAAIGVTPAGEAASRTVRAARFARDTEAVNGIAASRQPRPHQLLALGRDAKYPASAVPAVVGAEGPQGAQGAPGPRGPKGASGGDLVMTYDYEGSSYPIDPFERLTMAELDGVPAGNWLVLAGAFSASIHFEVQTHSCHITRGGRDLASSSAAAGRGAGGQRINGHLAIAGVTLDAPSTLRWRCAKDGRTGSKLEGISLTAIRVGRLDVRRADP